MKKEEDFELDYQTKSPITETPDPDAPKMPVIPIKKVMTGIALFFVCVFAYNFHSMQKEVITEYKKNQNNEKDTINMEEHQKRMDGIKRFSEMQKNTLVQRIAGAYNEIFFGYLASLNYTKDNIYKDKYTPVVFQKAQKDFLDLNEKVKELEEDIKKNTEVLEEEKKYLDYIQLNMSLWKYAFEKASNSQNIWLIAEQMQKVSSSDYAPNKEVCGLVESNVPEFKVILKCE